jgi:hypothetical protein
MNTANEHRWLNDPAASRTRTRRTAERFVAYSRSVLELIKKDAEAGICIDPAVIRELEQTIARHEPDARRADDVSESLNRISRYGGHREN